MLGHSIKRLSTSSLPCDHFSSLFSSVIYHYSQVKDLFPIVIYHYKSSTRPFPCLSCTGHMLLALYISHRPHMLLATVFLTDHK